MASATDRNIQTLAAEAKRMREEMSALTERSNAMDKKILALSRELDTQRQQFGIMMARMFRGGPTRGND